MKLDKEELVKQVDGFLKELFSKAGLNLRFRCEPEETVLNIRLYGPDAALVLSNNARLLYAINRLLNQIFFRKSAEGLNFLVDCNDYRPTRVLELQLLAKKAAEQVKVSGIAFPLQPMPAMERRVIHLTLAEEPGIRTLSEGGGERRHVVILPA